MTHKFKNKKTKIKNFVKIRDKLIQKSKIPQFFVAI